MATLRVLIVEDDQADVELITRELTKSGFDPVCLRVDKREEFSSRLVEERPEHADHLLAQPHVGGQVRVGVAVDGDDPVTFRQKSVYYCLAEISGSSGDKDGAHG